MPKFLQKNCMKFKKNLVIVGMRKGRVLGVPPRSANENKHNYNQRVVEKRSLRVVSMRQGAILTHIYV